MGMRLWTDQTFFTWYSRFRDGRELVEDDDRGGLSKSTLIEVNIAAYADLVKNGRWIARIKNDNRIFEHPQDCSFFGLWKRIWERECCVHVLFHAPWHLNKGKFESHLAKVLSRWPMETKFLLAKFLRETKSGLLSMTPKQSDRVLNGLVRHPLGRRNWNFKGPASREC